MMQVEFKSWKGTTINSLPWRIWTRKTNPWHEDYSWYRKNKTLWLSYEKYIEKVSYRDSTWARLSLLYLHLQVISSLIENNALQVWKTRNRWRRCLMHRQLVVWCTLWYAQGLISLMRLMSSIRFFQIQEKS